MTHTGIGTAADSRRMKQILPQQYECTCSFSGSERVRKRKFHVNQTHFIWNKTQPSCISPLTEITMTRNASDPFGRQSRMSLSSVIPACSDAGHCSQGTEILSQGDPAVETVFSKGTHRTSEEPGCSSRSRRPSAGQNFSSSCQPGYPWA